MKFSAPILAALSFETANAECQVPGMEFAEFNMMRCRHPTIKIPYKMKLRSRTQLANWEGKYPDGSYCSYVTCNAIGGSVKIRKIDKEKLGCINGEWKIVKKTEDKSLKVLKDPEWPTCWKGCPFDHTQLLKYEYTNKDKTFDFRREGNITYIHPVNSRSIKVSCDCDGLDCIKPAKPVLMRCECGASRTYESTIPVCQLRERNHPKVIKDEDGWRIEKRNLLVDTMSCSKPTTQWSEWSECPPHGGLQKRTRNCDIGGQIMANPNICGRDNIEETRNCGTPIKYKKHMTLKVIGIDDGSGTYYGIKWHQSTDHDFTGYAKTYLQNGFDGLSSTSTPSCKEVGGKWWDRSDFNNYPCTNYVFTKGHADQWARIDLREDYEINVVKVSKGFLDTETVPRGHPIFGSQNRYMWGSIKAVVTNRDIKTAYVTSDMEHITDCGIPVEAFPNFMAREHIQEYNFQCPEGTTGRYMYLIRWSGGDFGFEDISIYGAPVNR